MSRAQYDSLMENLHIRHSKPNYERLKESIKQAEEGKLVNFDVEDSHMNVSFTENYLYWQKMDKKIVKRVSELIKDIKRTPFVGPGKPEPLKYDLAGKWSRGNLTLRLSAHILQDTLYLPNQYRQPPFRPFGHKKSSHQI